MREELSTPAPPVPAGDDPLQTTVIRYKHAIGFTPRTDLEAIGAWLRLLVITGHLATLSGAELRVLCVLAAGTNGEKYREKTIMFSWPGEVTLATRAGVRGGSVYRATRDVEAIGLLKPQTEQIDGEAQDGWLVVSPEEAPAPRDVEPVRSFRKKKVRKFRGIEGRHYARATGGARSEPTRRAPPAARSARHGRRAQNAESTLDNARACAPAQKSETPKSSNNNKPTTTDGVEWAKALDDRGVVVVELGKQGIGKKVAMSLASLPTTTRLLAKAAALQAATRPEQHRTGKLVELLRDPDLIAQKYIDQAESMLIRPAPKPIEPGTPPDVETQKRGAQLLREALAKAKAGEA